MELGLLLGLIGAGTSLITSGASIGAAVARNKKQQKWTQQNMRLSSNLQRQNYDYSMQRQQEYIDPSHQRALYENANLNPALMYGNGAGGHSLSSSMGSAPTGSADVQPIYDSADSSSLNNAVGDIADTAYKTTLAKQAEAETQYRLTQIADPTPVKPGERPTPAQIAYEYQVESWNQKKYGNEIQKIELEIARDTKGTRKDMIKEQLENIRKRLVNDTALSQSMVEWYNSQADLFGAQKIDMEATRASRISASQASANRDNAQASIAPSQIAANAASAAANRSLVDLNEAQTLLANASREEVSARISKYEKEKEKIDAEIVRIGKENNLTDQHIREIKNNIALRWAVFGVNTAQTIISEARKWINPLSSIADMKRENRYLQDLLDDKDVFFAD